MSYLMTIDDMDTFIGLIEKRPSLYMKNLKEYTDTNVRKKLWEEVCTEIVPNWAELSAESRIKYGEWFHIVTWIRCRKSRRFVNFIEKKKKTK